MFQRREDCATLSSFYFYPSSYKLHLRGVNKNRLNVTGRFAGSASYNRCNCSGQIISMNFSVLPVHTWEWGTRGARGEGLWEREWVGEKSPELLILFGGLNLSSLEENIFFFFFLFFPQCTVWYGSICPSDHFMHLTPERSSSSLRHWAPSEMTWRKTLVLSCAGCWAGRRARILSGNSKWV